MSPRIEAIARIAHEVNRAYCESMGDTSQPAWSDAPDWQRASAMNGVRFALANPGVTPAESHANWMQEKEAAGWAYGTAKDPAAKTHPCFLPYEELSHAQRVKDSLFLAVVHAALERPVLA